MDISLTYDGVAQPLQVVAFDGVPTGSKDGTHQGSIVTETHLLLPPSARAEFIVTAPASPSAVALLSTAAIDGGPFGDSNPARPLASIVTDSAPVSLHKIAVSSAQARKMRFDDQDAV